ncbi:lantibiotic dehydratase [Microbacterium sp. NPDC087589]|uniref:lantibiotic dehydratase n=1 Tax=Microbacterium sp. NPDC087589 TaxID=3364191 RepID=UPI0037FA2100
MSKHTYRAADFFLLRAAATPLQQLLDFYEQTRDLGAEDLLQELIARSADPEMRRALWIASPDLISGIDRWIDNAHTPPTKRQRKAARGLRSRLLRYYIRSASRATPFGAFAGVGWGRFDGDASAPVLPPATSWRQRTRSDIAWVLDLVRQIEESVVGRAVLPVSVNALTYISGGRVVLPVADTHGKSDTRRISVRHTPPVERAMAIAATSPTLAGLQVQLGEEFPDTPPAAVAHFVNELWDLHFLTSDLRPSLAHPRADAQLLERLEAMTGIDDQLIDDLRRALREVVVTSGDDGLDVVALGNLAATQRSVASEHSGVSLQVDMSFGDEVFAADAAIRGTIEHAYTALVKLAEVAPRQKHHLDRYRASFLERYGYGALVPVLNLLSPEDGIGAPETYENPPRPFPLENAESFQVEERDEYTATLAELLVETAQRGQHVVELDDAALNRLRASAPAHGKPLYPIMDAYVQVGDVGTGDGALAILMDTFAPGGRTFGRFVDVLPDDAVEQLRVLIGRWQQDRPDAVVAELCYLPSAGHATNVATRPLLCEYEVTINSAATAPMDRQISLDDLAVGITDDRFFLWSTRLGREVVVLQSHMLNEQMAHNVARFLLEVSTDGYHLPVGFSWGGLESMQSLPRVMHRNAILSLASWRLPQSLIVEMKTDDDATAAVDRWRRESGVPDLVYLAEDDNRLLLDLNHPACLNEIVTLLRRAESHGRGLQIEEAPFLEGASWTRGVDGLAHVSEIVVPLIHSDRRAGVLAPVPSAVGAPDVHAYNLPGEEWVFLKVYASVEQQEQIIAEALPAFIALPEVQSLYDRWFFIRYLDTRPHLRIRFRARDVASQLPLLGAAVSFATELVQSNLATHHAVVPYAPETGRYGGPAVYDMVEATFEYASHVAVEATRRNLDNGGDISPELIGVAAVLALYTAWGYEWSALLDVLPEGQASERAREYYRDEKDQIASLAHAARHGFANDTAGSLYERIASELASLRLAGDAVREAAARGTLQGSERDILRSLAHMLINRSLPVDLDREAGVYHLVREAVRVINSREAARELVIR